jgi:hypothetical protein
VVKRRIRRSRSARMAIKALKWFCIAIVVCVVLIPFIAGTIEHGWAYPVSVILFLAAVVGAVTL